MQHGIKANRTPYSKSNSTGLEDADNSHLTTGTVLSAFSSAIAVRRDTNCKHESIKRGFCIYKTNFRVPGRSRGGHGPSGPTRVIVTRMGRLTANRITLDG